MVRLTTCSSVAVSSIFTSVLATKSETFMQNIHKTLPWDLLSVMLSFHSPLIEQEAGGMAGKKHSGSNGIRRGFQFAY